MKSTSAHAAVYGAAIKRRSSRQWHVGVAVPAAIAAAVAGLAALRAQTGDSPKSETASSYLKRFGLVRAVEAHALYDPPVGAVMAYAGKWSKEREIQTGWMLCDGRDLPAVNFEDLAHVIPPSDGKIYLPNLCGRTIVGAGKATDEAKTRDGKKATTERALNEFGGEETHALTLREMPRHNHGVNDPGHSHTLKFGHAYLQPKNPDGWGTPRFDEGHNVTADPKSIEQEVTKVTIKFTGGNGSEEKDAPGEPHENMPPYWALNYIIKVSPTPLDPATLSNTQESRRSK